MENKNHVKVNWLLLTWISHWIVYHLIVLIESIQVIAGYRYKPYWITTKSQWFIIEFIFYIKSNWKGSSELPED